VSISADAFSAVLLDVVGSLAEHGVRHFLFVNGHMGNQNILGVLTNRIRFELHHHAANAFYFTQARDVIARHAKTDRWGHACEVETSVAMALVPELVRSGEAAAGDLIEEYGYLEDNADPHAVQVPLSFAERTRNGAFGYATQASVEAGEEIVATAVERIAGFARDFLAKPAPARP
jgi:creatinine amidohydrolase